MSFEFVESVSVCFPDVNQQVRESFFESQKTDSNRKLVIEVAAIHQGLTANYNNYTEAELTASLQSWVDPYPRPVILNHDPESDPKGRVMAARMDRENDGTPFSRLQVAILDPEAIARVMDGRYVTGSVGGKATTAMCSICNTDWAKPSETIPCRHSRGKIYNGKLAFLDLGGLSWREYSFVNMPADAHSGVRQPSGDGGEWIKSARLYSVNMNEESILELNESENPVNILENMKKKDAHYTYMNVKGTFLTATAYDYKENMDTNITFDKTITTIDNELSTESLTQNSEELKTSEEIVMSTEEKTEDLVSIVQSLSADLAASQEEVVEPAEEDNSTETSETDSSDTASDELSENSDVKTDPEEEKIEAKEDSEEDKDETVDSNEQLSETTDTPEEQAEQTESTEDEEVTPDPKDEVIASLTAENDKLKNALHFMLAERVVDTKISLGMVSTAERADALTEHSTRTAASLADAIRDLEKLSVSPNLPFAKETITKIITPKAHATEEKDSDRVIEEAEDTTSKEVHVSPAKKLEDIIVTKLMAPKPF